MPTPPNFNEAVIVDVLAAVESYCLQTGRFDSVNKHEPTNAPGRDLTCAIWVDGIKPIKRSGLSATSGSLSLRIRIYMPFRSEPYDVIDSHVLAAVSELMGAFIGDFQFSATASVNDSIRCVDIRGGEGSGEMLDARAGYLEMDRKIYRIMTIRLPIIVNDMWTEAA